MPRKGPAPKRPLVNDPVYGSQLVTQLVNKVLLQGKKSLAERIVYAALEQAREKTGTDPVITCETVPIETPANSATCLIVDMSDERLCGKAGGIERPILP